MNKDSNKSNTLRSLPKVPLAHGRGGRGEAGRGRVFFLAFLLCCIWGGSASARSLVLQLSDSTEVYFLLDDNPVMTFPKGKVCIDDKAYAFSDVARFYISETDAPDAVETLMARSGIRMQSGQLVVSSKARVQLFSADGKRVSAPQRTVAGKTIVSLERLPRGTYIVRVGADTMKFNKK